MIVIDIETMPNMSIIDKLPEPKIDSRLKDQEKIGAAIKKAKQAQIDSMALSPLYGRVASVCALVGTVQEMSAAKGCTDEHERGVVVAAMRTLTLSNNARPELVTFNGITFDLPFLYTRAMVLGIDISDIGVPPLSFWTRRYSTTPHCDLCQVLAGWDRQAMRSLDEWATVLLGKSKLPFDVAAIKTLVTTDDGRSQLLEYNWRDVELTAELHARCSGYLY